MAQREPVPYPVRPITEEEFDGFVLVDNHAFHGSPTTRCSPCSRTRAGSGRGSATRCGYG